MRGITTRWLIGPRRIIESADRNGRNVVRHGKNGGPVIEQTVVKLLLPKGTPA